MLVVVNTRVVGKRAATTTLCLLAFVVVACVQNLNFANSIEICEQVNSETTTTTTTTTVTDNNNYNHHAAHLQRLVESLSISRSARKLSWPVAAAVARKLSLAAVESGEHALVFGAIVDLIWRARVLSNEQRLASALTTTAFELPTGRLVFQQQQQQQTNSMSVDSSATHLPHLPPSAIANANLNANQLVKAALDNANLIGKLVEHSNVNSRFVGAPFLKYLLEAKRSALQAHDARLSTVRVGLVLDEFVGAPLSLLAQAANLQQQQQPIDAPQLRNLTFIQQMLTNETSIDASIGRWFAHLDFDARARNNARWLLSFATPIVATTTTNSANDQQQQASQIRGVSLVTIDAEGVNQCIEGGDSLMLLANTNQCKLFGKQSRIIVSSSWLMLESMTVGALLLYGNVFARLFEPQTSVACLIEPWTRELGFAILYGAVLIKLYKLYTDFQTRKAHRVCFSDKDLLAYLLAIVIIVVVYMSAWTALVAEGFKQRSFESSNSFFINEDDNHQINVNNLTQAMIVDKNAHYFDKQHHANAAAAVTADSSSSSSSQLFAGLVEQSAHYDAQSDSLVYSTRCRHLVWNYVTELSELAFLSFGVYLVYKLRNAKKEARKETLALSVAIFVELIVSGATYLFAHLNLRALSSKQQLLLYSLRCHLTVSVCLALVLGPKLWLIGKNKPILLIKTLGQLGSSSSNAASYNNQQQHLQGKARSPIVSSSALLDVVGTNQLDQQLDRNLCNDSHSNIAAANIVTRHRCQVSGDMHAQHMQDAARLHQALLESSALNFGAIHIADMDPDEIQAELKRVYAQLELLQTKLMRRDNPHISKRRGGKKPTHHRKFSLQAFHPKLHSNSTTPTTSNADSKTQHKVVASNSEAEPTSKASVSECGLSSSVSQSQVVSNNQQQQQQQQSARKNKLSLFKAFTGRKASLARDNATCCNSDSNKNATKARKTVKLVESNNNNDGDDNYNSRKKKHAHSNSNNTCTSRKPPKLRANNNDDSLDLDENAFDFEDYDSDESTHEHSLH